MITTVATEYTGNVPNRDDGEDKFNVDMPNMLSHLVIFSPELNEITAEINSTIEGVNVSAEAVQLAMNQVVTAAALAVANANATPYDNDAPYRFPALVVCTDGQSYRCVSVDADVVGDNPVGSVTGNWVQNSISVPTNLLTKADAFFLSSL